MFASLLLDQIIQKISKMNIQDIRELTTKELVDTYKETRLTLTKMRFQNVISQIEQPHTMGETRKTIARLLGEINKRRIESEMAAFERKSKIEG